MIEAAFPFNKETLKEAYRVHRSLRRWTKWLRFFSWVALAGGLWLLVKERRFLEGGIVCGIAAFLLVWPYLSRALWLRVIGDHPFFDQDLRCRFDTQGFAMAAKGKGIQLAWDEVFKIVEGDRGYLIYPKSGAFYYIPASGFATEIDAGRVKGLFLSEKMRRT